MKQLNQEDAAWLFHKYAFWVGKCHVIPEDTARDVLSDAAVDFMYRTGKPGESFNTFGAGDRKQLNLITFKGFLEAVSYYNVELYFTEPRAVNIQGTKSARKKNGLYPLQANQ